MARNVSRPKSSDFGYRPPSIFPLQQILRDRPQALPLAAQRLQRLHCLAGQPRGLLAGSLKADDRGVGRLVDGGILADWSAGFNWYPTYHMKFMFNAILANLESAKPVSIFQMRLQVAY